MALLDYLPKRMNVRYIDAFVRLRDERYYPVEGVKLLPGRSEYNIEELRICYICGSKLLQGKHLVGQTLFLYS